MGAFGGAQNRVGAHGIIAHSSSAPSLRRPVDDASVGRGVLSTKAATAAAARTLRVALAFGRASLAALHLLVQLCGGGLSTGSVRAAPSTLGRVAAGPVCRYRYRALRLIALRDWRLSRGAGGLGRGRALLLGGLRFGLGAHWIRRRGCVGTALLRALRSGPGCGWIRCLGAGGALLLRALCSRLSSLSCWLVHRRPGAIVAFLPASIAVLIDVSVATCVHVTARGFARYSAAVHARAGYRFAAR